MPWYLLPIVKVVGEYNNCINVFRLMVFKKRYHQFFGTGLSEIFETVNVDNDGG